MRNSTGSISFFCQRLHTLYCISHRYFILSFSPPPKPIMEFGKLKQIIKIQSFPTRKALHFVFHSNKLRHKNMIVFASFSRLCVFRESKQNSLSTFGWISFLEYKQKETILFIPNETTFHKFELIWPEKSVNN